MARWTDFSPDTWVAKAGFQDEDDLTAYIYCFYFVIQVLTTVGYGDMPVSTSAEKLLVILIELVGVIVFSFAVGSLMSVLTNLDSRAAQLKSKT